MTKDARLVKKIPQPAAATLPRPANQSISMISSGTLRNVIRAITPLGMPDVEPVEREPAYGVGRAKTSHPGGESETVLTVDRVTTAAAGTALAVGCSSSWSRSRPALGVVGQVCTIIVFMTSRR